MQALGEEWDLGNWVCVAASVRLHPDPTRAAWAPVGISSTRLERLEVSVAQQE